jgi:hypothetical protein
VNHPAPRRRVNDPIPQPEDGGEDAADLHHEHDRVLRDVARIELPQAVERRRADDHRVEQRELLRLGGHG